MTDLEKIDNLILDAEREIATLHDVQSDIYRRIDGFRAKVNNLYRQKQKAEDAAAESHMDCYQYGDVK